MAEQTIDHELIERVLGTEPKHLLDRLPDCIETREARRLAKVTEDLAHQAHERRQTEA